VGDQVQRGVRPVGELDGQELAVPGGPGDHPADQRGDGRVERLDRAHAGHVDPRHRPVHGVLSQVVGEGLDFGELGHADLLG
jgi:hypothetical protein